MLFRKSATVLLIAAVGLSSVAGCESKAGSGALIGGGAGAGAGAIIGHQTGHTAGGALIGGAIGALGGALIGGAMDNADKKAEKEQREYEAYREKTYYRPVQTSSYTGARAVTKEDVIAWSAKGTRSDIIVDRIEQSGSKFYLTAADENQLRDAGVSPDVIRKMKETGRY